MCKTYCCCVLLLIVSILIVSVIIWKYNCNYKNTFSKRLNNYSKNPGGTSWQANSKNTPTYYVDLQFPSLGKDKRGYILGFQPKEYVSEATELMLAPGADYFLNEMMQDKRYTARKLIPPPGITRSSTCQDYPTSGC